MATKRKVSWAIDIRLVKDLEKMSKRTGQSVSSLVNSILAESLKSDELMLSLLGRKDVMRAVLDMVNSPAFRKGVVDVIGKRVEGDQAADMFDEMKNASRGGPH